MSLTTGTQDMVKQIVLGSNISDNQLDEIWHAVQAARRNRRQQAPRAPSGNTNASAAPIRPLKNRPSRKPSGSPQGSIHGSAQPDPDFFADWSVAGDDGMSPKPVDNTDSINYEPDESVFEDNDFENARNNREHIDNVMKRMF